jgi:hypothetical protein
MEFGMYSATWRPAAGGIWAWLLSERMARASHVCPVAATGQVGVVRCSAIELPPSMTRYCPVM